MTEAAVTTTIDDILALCDRRYQTRPCSVSDKSKRTYVNNYRNFLKWYADNVNDTTMALNTEDGTDGPVYATQHNANMYYLHYVTKEVNGTRANAKRYLYAINWFRCYFEKPDSEPLVESSTIKTSLQKQQDNFNARASETYAGVDPHKGLRDLMPEEDTVTLCKYMWSHRADYADLLFCYTWGRNAGVRGSSSRAFQLCDLNLSKSYGPESTPPRNRTLMLILRKGSRHKDKSTVDKQVGVWRHRDYRQCSVFATGVIVINLLRRLGTRIEFTQRNKKADANWWGIDLCNFNRWNEESNAMKEVYSNTHIDPNCKITHHRTQAVLLGATKGLNNRQISSYTKHVQDKLHRSYLPDCEEMALKVMSGFKKTEHRFVKEEHITFPGYNSMYLDECTELLIPEYKNYRAQANAQSDSDDSRCCKTFLFNVLPFLVETVLQDGIYFTRDFPKHEFSNLLVNTIPGYSQFAREERERIKNLQQTIIMDAANNLNASQAIALGGLQQQLLNQEERIKHLDSTISTISASYTQHINLLCNQQKVITERMFDFMQDQHSRYNQLLQQQHQQQQVNHNNNNQHQQQELQEEEQEDDDYEAMDVFGAEEDDGSTQQQQQHEAVLQQQPPIATTTNALARLLPTPREPIINPRFPNSWLDFYTNWCNGRLADFMNARKSDWSADVRNRFSKHVGAYQQMQRRHRELNAARSQGSVSISYERVALILDQEKDGRGMSISLHLKSLKKEDSNIATRRKRNENNNINNNFFQININNAARNNNNVNNNTARINNNNNNGNSGRNSNNNNNCRNNSTRPMSNTNHNNTNDNNSNLLTDYNNMKYRDESERRRDEERRRVLRLVNEQVRQQTAAHDAQQRQFEMHRQQRQVREQRQRNIRQQHQLRNNNDNTTTTENNNLGGRFYSRHVSRAIREMGEKRVAPLRRQLLNEHSQQLQTNPLLALDQEYLQKFREIRSRTFNN